MILCTLYVMFFSFCEHTIMPSRTLLPITTSFWSCVVWEFASVSPIGKTNTNLDRII